MYVLVRSSTALVFTTVKLNQPRMRARRKISNESMEQRAVEHEKDDRRKHELFKMAAQAAP